MGLLATRLVDRTAWHLEWSDLCTRVRANDKEWLLHLALLAVRA